MCLWIIAACLSIAPPQLNYVVPPPIIGAPPPILIPTSIPSTSSSVSTPLTIPTLPPTNATTASTTTTTLSTTTTGTTRNPATVSTLPTLTPITSLPTTGLTTPTGITPTQQTIPIIDPRGTALSLKILPEKTIKFSEDFQDVVIEIDLTTDPVRFPRDKRSIKKRFKRQATSNCGCFLPNQCPLNPNQTDGSGFIDFRVVNGGNNIQQCLTGLKYCCIPIPPATTTSTTITTTATTISTTPIPIPQQSCGSRIQSSIIYPTQMGQARYGDFPWMVVILTTDNLYVGGAILIDTQHILTTAHRIANYPNGVGLKIRLGEWDAAGNYEQYPYRDFQILKIWTHESFNPNNLQNDISLIRIVGGLSPGSPGIVPICMPGLAQVFDGQRCWVSGWGKNSFGVTGLYQTVLKTVDITIIPQNSCELILRSTRLGQYFVLDRNSFICAGGELDKDACTGDGGSGLVCEITPGKWTLAGLVAWGLGCATQGIPGVYVNIVNFLPWIATKILSP